MPLEQVNRESVRDVVKCVEEREHGIQTEAKKATEIGLFGKNQKTSKQTLKKKSYLNKLPRNTEVRIFLKFKENSGTFFLKKQNKKTY